MPPLPPNPPTPIPPSVRRGLGGQSSPFSGGLPIESRWFLGILWPFVEEETTFRPKTSTKTGWEGLESRVLFLVVSTISCELNTHAKKRFSGIKRKAPCFCGIPSSQPERYINSTPSTKPIKPNQTNKPKPKQQTQTKATNQNQTQTTTTSSPTKQSPKRSPISPMPWEVGESHHRPWKLPLWLGGTRWA